MTVSCRVRAWIAVLAFRHLAVSIVLAANGSYYVSREPFSVIFALSPPWVWATIFGTIGVAALGVFAFPSETRTRVLVVVSVGVTLLWALGFIAAQVSEPGQPGVLVAIAFLALAAKDAVFVSMPILDPHSERVLSNR